MNSDVNKLDFKMNTASEAEILLHLSDCSHSFIPQLNSRVDVAKYAERIAKHSVTFEAWNDNKLIGLLAAYFNDVEYFCGYITNVSVYKEYEGKGVASRLLEQSISYAGNNKFKEILLEVNELNLHAIKLYKKHNFATKNKQGDCDVMYLVINNSKI